MMPSILATKLYIPLSHAESVARPRLIDQLNAGIQQKLTLISAPAGFGKTTLLRDWIAVCGRQAAWLSLDEGDNDITRFLSYFVAALQTLQPDIGETVRESLKSAQIPPTEALVTALLNEIAAISEPFLLVLDDYHVIETQAVDAALTFLLEYLPPQAHLVIATRHDPPLPLPRWRVRRELNELRVKDLRFTPDEAAGFLNQLMGLNLSQADIIALDKRTEGWIAGLQLAALSIQGRDDTDTFIRAFTGSHRFVLDYLVEEVLHRQPDAIRHFLLQTAILNRLHGGLCDALTGADDGHKVLEMLERGNLFVVSLDETRQWYRYHHLFADALRANLQADYPDMAAALHLKACAWYTRHDFPDEAIHHALAAGDQQRAAELIEWVWPRMDEAYQSNRWIQWVRSLPEAVISSRPLLSLGAAWALLNGGDLEAAEIHLQAAERGMDDLEQNPLMVENEQLRSLPAAVAGARAYRALTKGDIEAAQEYARQARALSVRPEHPSFRQGTALMGITHWITGDVAAALPILQGFQADMWRIEQYTDAISISFVITDIQLIQGELRQTVKACEDLLQQVLKLDEPLPLGTHDLYCALGRLYCERGQLEQATAQLDIAEQVGVDSTMPNWIQRLNMAQARLKLAQGNWDDAVDLLDEAERLYTLTPLPIVPAIAAQRARIWIQQGKLDDAQAWAAGAALTPDGELSYLREYDYITLARLLIARYQHEGTDALWVDALHLLDRLHDAAAAGNRTGHRIHILILQARAYQAAGQINHALTALQNALTLAEPEGFLQVFVDEGDAMKHLLHAVSQQGSPAGFARRLHQHLTQPQAAAAPASPPQPLIEPLSERELDVLRLLGTDLNGPEIARELMISLNTMRTHTKNIYSKLGVNSRRTAVRRAEALALI